MEEEELNELLGDSKPLKPINDLGYLFEEETTDIRNLGLDAPQRSKYDGPFSHLSRPELFSASKAMNANEAFSYRERPEYADYVKEAADRTIREKRAVQDGKVVDLDMSQWQDSMLSGFGYGDILYVRPIAGTESEDRKRLDREASRELERTQVTPFSSGGGDARIAGYLLSYFLERFDDGQVYDFLVPSVSPEDGKPIMEVIRGTYEEVIQRGYNPLNKFGIKSESDGVMTSLLKGAANTLGETDDVILGAAKFAQDLIYKPFTDGEETALDEIWDDTIKHTERNQFLLSEKADEFGSLEWLASGTGSAFASLGQYAGIGRTLRGVSLATLGSVAGKKAVSRAVFDKIASYGSSGIIGFGYAYNEALQNGLTGGDALLYGGLVGLVTAAIEHFTGQDFDRFLTGGGVKMISRDIMREMGGEVTEAGMKKWLKERSGDFVKRVPGRLKNMASEGTEEVLQDIVEQGAQLTYNALLADKGAEKGEGMFDIDEFNFKRTVGAGIFGAIAASPFHVGTKNPTGKMALHIMEGRADKVTDAINNLRAEGKIDDAQHRSLMNKKQELEEAFNVNRALFDGISGEHAAAIKNEAFQLVLRRRDLEQEMNKVLKGTKDKEQEEREDVKNKRQQIQAEIDKVTAVIEKYQDPEFIRQRVQKFKDDLAKIEESRNNIFARIASDAVYNPDQSQEDTLSRIGSLKSENFTSSVLIRTPSEAAYAIGLLSEGKIDKSLGETIARDVLAQGLHRSPVLNTMANREMLLSLGININELPLTPEEKADVTNNPEKYAERFMSPVEFDEKLSSITDDMLAADSETARPDLQYGKYDRVMYLIKNREALGVTTAQLHSLDVSENVLSQLDSDQAEAIKKVYETANPTAIIHIGGSGSPRGAYHRGTGVMFIEGAIDSISELQKSGVSDDRIKSLKNDLFHVLAHETGHALFDSELEVVHRAWMKVKTAGASKGGGLTPRQVVNAEYFDRLLNLSLVSYEVLKDKPGAKRMYFFNKIVPAFLGKDQKGRIEGAITVVKEYFAEAFANKDFQDLLDSYDLASPKNRERLKELNYNYNPVVAKKESLLSQAVKAVASVFARLRNVLTRDQRTLLAEAFALGSNLQFNKFIPGRVAQEISELSFSHYDAVNLYEGEQIDPEEVLATLLKRLDKAQARLNEADRIQLMKKMREFVGNTFSDKNPYGEYLKGSMIVLYFKSTDGFMISWKTINNSGETESNRAFFNKRGGQVFVNTNVKNTESDVTLAKPYIFQAFDQNNKGEEWDNARAILNNLERARSENFEGEAFLELDRDKVWEFNGKQVQGQINVVYRFKDGETAVVGFAPDLAKVRLAHLIENGSRINVKLRQAGPGSRAWVKRDENGMIVDVLHSNTTLPRSGYTLENVSPGVLFNYLEDSNVPDVAERVATAVDTITADDKESTPRVDNNFLQGGANLLSDPNPDDVIPSFSLYDDSSFDVPPSVEYVRNGLERYMRKSMYFSPGQTYDRDRFYSVASIYIRKAAEYLKNEMPEQDESINDKLGFDNDEAFVNFCDEVIADLAFEFRSKAGRNRDRENWDGVGGNPDGKISSGIKADLEAINYSWDGQKHWVDYDDVKDILFEAAGNTSNFNEMVKYLGDMLNEQRRAGRDLAILEAVYRHLATSGTDPVVKPKQKQEDTPELQRERAFFDTIKNSYWSQFGSYIHLDAITVATQGEGAFVYLNGENSFLQGVREEFIGNAIQRVNQARDASGDSGVFDRLKKDMTDFAIDRYTKIYQKQGMTEEEAYQKANGLLKKKSDVISEIRSLMWYYKRDGIRKVFGTRGPGKYMFYKNREDYDRMAALADSYFAFFGYEIPQGLFRLNRGKEVDALGVKKKQLIAQGMSEQDANKEIARISENVRLNDYHLVSFKASVSNNKGADREYGEFPFIVLANQAADFFTNEVKKMSENDPSANPDISELKELVRNVERASTGYRSPEFYFNAEFNKEWSRKIRSHTDDLIDKLRKPGSELMKKYQESEMYKDNRFLESIRKLKGDQVQFMIAGIRGTEPGSGKSFESVGDLDYIYMNVSGYVHNSSSPFYYHIDDVPSDKPRISAFRMLRIRTKDIRAEIARIQEIERKRIELANDRFSGDGVDSGAFEFAKTRGKDKDGKKIIYYKIRSKSEFDSLIPGVHYKEVDGVTEDGEKLYVKGSIFSDDNKFYGGGTVDDVTRKITEEYERAYESLKKDGMNFPVSTQFIRELNERNLSPEARTAELESERRRVFSEWYANYVINRFHLSMVLMGDHAYYKSNDGFVDLSKRHAGTVAPFSRGVHGRSKIKVSIIDDADIDEEGNRLAVPILKQDSDGNLTVSDDEDRDLTGNTNRTDAQGYVTERYARELQDAYGAFSGYEKIFKPVMFGVNDDMIKYAQPLYLKLSLAVLPDPGEVDGNGDRTFPSEENERFYTNYPELLPVADKIYASGSDIAVFTSGVKVGVNTVNKLSDDEFKAIEFDSNLFGLQNNPHHDPNSDENFLNGMVQQTKQLGDNGNFEAFMSLYHEIEGGLVAGRASNFFEDKFSNHGTLIDLIKERLAQNNHTVPLSEFIDAGVRPLDNPATYRYSENLVNSDFKKAVSLFPKDGEKLVNMSELGMGRPPLNSDESGIRERILRDLAIPVTEYNRKLQWVGPRKPQDLTIEQLIELKKGVDSGLMSIDSRNGYITQVGSVKIYPAEALVPEGPNYKIGDRIIATRIPTAKKSNSTAAIVVGFTHEAQGNVIVLGKHGTAVHGYDFDIDGMFVWRERQREANQPVREMFGIAWDVLTSPQNYNEVTSPVTTDNIKRLAGEIDKVIKPFSGYSKFSPMRQVELKRLNSVGKSMIGAFANRSGVHSVLAQNNGSPFLSNSAIDRRYATGEGVWSNRFVDHYVDRSGNKVLVSDVYSELINAATDNAKLQFLGRLNINAYTAPVLSDMISHGFSLDYAIYFINQPAIRELVRRSEIQSASSTDTDDTRIINQMMTEYEEKIKQENPGYEYNRKNSMGVTEPGSKSVIHYVLDGNGDIVPHRADRAFLDFESLNSGLTDNDLEKQLIILDKFRFYKSLARVTSDAGALVTLTSSYPKTFVELVETRRRIAEAAGIDTENGGKIDIMGLISNHGMYRVQWEGLNNLIESYAKFKTYAVPPVVKIHEAIAGGKSIELQQKVHDDFYTYMLATEEGEYDLSTASLFGKLIDPYHFVNESAKLIDALKREFPDNEFLRILSVNISKGTPEQFRDKAIEPSTVDAKLLYEPSGELLKKIHEDFMALPDGIRWTSDDIVNDEVQELEEFVAKPKDVILGHLLYTKGFGLGGFNFTKILPPQVVKSLDRVIDNVHARLSHTVVDDDYVFDIIPNLGLSSFVRQIKYNHPELINEIYQDEVDAAKRIDGDHFDLWNHGQNEDPDADYDGAIKRVRRADGGETITFMYKKNVPENNLLIKRMIGEGLVRMRNAKNNLRVYSVSNIQVADVGKYKAAYVVLDEVNIRPMRNLKQYGPVVLPSKSADYVEGHKYAEVEQEVAQVEDPVEETAPTPVYPTLQVTVDAEAMKSGRKTAVTVEGPVDLDAGQTIMLPSGDGSVIAEVESVYSLGAMLDIMKNRGLENAEQRLINRWAELEGVQPVLAVTNSPANWLASRYQIKLKYIAHVGADGKIRHRARGDNGEAFSRFDPIPEFSEYRPYEISGLYKSVAMVAASKLKGRSNVEYDPATRDAFMATLADEGFDSVQMQVIKDMINHWGGEATDTHTIAGRLEAMAGTPGNIGLKHFNDVDSYERGTKTPLERMYAVGEGLFGPEWGTRLVHDFDRFADIAVNEEFIVSPTTGEPYTHYEWLEINFNRFLREEALMDEIKARIDEAGGVKSMSYEELVDIYSTIKQKMGVVDGLIWKENKDFIQQVGHQIGVLAEARSFKIIGDKTGNYQYVEQRDIKTWEEEITSITDLTEKQAAVQEIGRMRSTLAIKADIEKEAVMSEMERLMRAVSRAYYAHKPKSFVDKISFWKRSAQARDPFDYMFERDPDNLDINGEPMYTGRMVPRYQQNEADIRKMAFERMTDNEGNKTVYFKISNRKILKQVLEDSDKLSPVERAKVAEIAERYNSYIDFHKMFETMTEEQKLQSRKDTTIIRELFVRSQVRKEDSQFFKDLKKEARDFAGTARGDLASARIALYDFLYEKSNDLLADVGHFVNPVERGIMPQTSADLQELYSRYGIKEAWDKFINDSTDDIDALGEIKTTASGVAIPPQVKDFSTSFVVPFRTLREKENFSVSAPQIFAHHFKSLIFKKHHDELLPMMDAVKAYYEMKQRLGEGTFNNLINFIEEHANQRIFFKQRDFTKTKFGKGIRGLGSMVVTQFLGFAPWTSLTNWIVGNTETYKHMIGEYGLSVGTRMFTKGFGRIISSNARGFFLDPKATAIMNYYGIETFTTSEVQRLGDILGSTQDILLALQKNSEIFVRGAAFFAEMSDNQWNAFKFEDGNLTVVDPDNVPSLEQVAEWKNKIGSIQGKYDDETKRLYHGNAVYQAAMLFGGWMIDYIRSRTGKLHTDQWGIKREGYYRTTLRVVTDYTRWIEHLKGKDTITDFEMQNLRKAGFDLFIKISMLLMQAVLDGDDPAQKWFYRYIGKVNEQLFFLLDLEAMVQRVKSPFAGLFPIEQLAKVFSATVELDVQKAADAGYSLVPGRQAINTVVGVAEYLTEE